MWIGCQKVFFGFKSHTFTPNWIGSSMNSETSDYTVEMDPKRIVQTELTEAQQKVASHQQGPLLVLAGPGSGKTTVVTKRIAKLIENGVAPWQILALTFTNKAANEMKERVHAQLNHEQSLVRGLTVSTFHSFCARFLRQWGERVIGTTSFSIYDSADQKNAVKEAIKRCELSSSNWKPASALAAISNAKNALINSETFAQEASDFYARNVAKIYRTYQSILNENNAVDFDDLLMLTAMLLQQDDEVRENVQERFQYLMVDEYQDTNHTQFVIANLIAKNHRNFCVVGDPDQSIYAWRGADISNILDFETQFSDCAVIPLGQNFRSTQHIVNTAASLIGHNKNRKEKQIYSELDEGEKPIVKTLMDEYEEAEAIVSETMELIKQGVPHKEMAVLYRVNALSRVLEDAFRRNGVPYSVARGTAFYDRKEVKHALAYLTLILNPKDNMACERVINVPTRGIGATSIQRLKLFAYQNQMSLLQAALAVTKEDGFSKRALNAMTEFANNCLKWREDSYSEVSMTAAASLADIVERVIRESGLEKLFSTNSTEEDYERLQNLEELVSASAEFEQRYLESQDEPQTPLVLLSEFMQQVALVSDADAIDPEQGAVTLMTLHASKGLEFDFIAIAGLEESMLPHQRAQYDEEQLEEERRLCFVGMTRARKHLLLTNARRRMHRGLTERTVTSRFLSELAEEHVDFGETEVAVNHVPAPSESKSASEIQLGSVVRHSRFGIGKVQKIMRRPRGSTVTVQFSTTVKHLVLEYANLELVDEFDYNDTPPEY